MREGTLQEFIGATANAFFPFDPVEALPIDPEGSIPFLQRMADMESPTSFLFADLKRIGTKRLLEMKKSLDHSNRGFENAMEKHGELEGKRSPEKINHQKGGGSMIKTPSPGYSILI